MLRHEVMQMLSTDEWGGFIKWMANKAVATITLPDNRKVVWYDDYEVHEYLKAREASGLETSKGEGFGTVQELQQVSSSGSGEATGPISHS